MTAQMESINDTLMILTLSCEFILVLMAVITLLYCLTIYCINYKESKAVAKKYEIYDKYRI